ncbi:TonB-dependent siderophore receptor [Ectopseudomonas toyotomiensis]|uniref:Iron complex outermembrane recepter protein n=1 Tax=Ectopseudomonas toyotomiensis TaxID=554344 RepID=A0A1I5XCH4_9GAMM|nr:TonB-dependent siderophore receptor [Pseudomonas toyotomiensis]PIA68430.1 TonB-dependent siderophore receptor [Pseudomonas toyotomiensis]SFQ29668.1 iron complex outermembrane recepter protein [Pseudomonas toyotomiensis]
MKSYRPSLSSQCAALLTLCLLPASQLLAQELELPSQEVVAKPNVEENGYQAKRASTASKSSVALKDEAQSVQVVTPQTIEDFQVRSLDDAMKFVSGVIQSNTLGGTKDAFIKRGFGTNSDGSVLRDGIRSNLSKNFTATSERVEVLKGPAALLYGAMDPGGLINVISKLPQYQQRTTVSGSAFSEGGGSLSLDTTGPIGDSGFAYRLITERQNEDYWRNYGSHEQVLIAPSLTWAGERTSLTLSYEYNDYSAPFDRGTVFIDGHPADIDYEKRLDERWAETRGIAESARAVLEYQLSDDWKSRFTYGWNNDIYGLSIAQPVSMNAATGAFRRVGNGAHYDDETRYSGLDFIGQQMIFGQRHDLLLGIEHELNDQYRGKTYRNPNGMRHDIDTHNPVYGNLPEPSVVSPTQSNRRNELTSTSVYFKDNWHLDDSWILVLGGRYQHYDQYIAQGLGASRTTLFDKNDQTLIPFTGLVYKASDALSLYGNYSRSFVPNTSVTDAGQTFDPEEGRSYEVGAKYDLRPGLSLNLALFDIVKENVVVGSGDDMEAAGKVGSRGVEVDLAGRIADDWELIATYAYTHTELLDDPSNKGNRLAQAPRHTGSLYLTHELPVDDQLGTWRVGGGTRYIGERTGDNADSFRLDSYTLADAFVRWEYPLLGHKTSLQLNLDNIFDKHYYPSTTGSQLNVSVGEPRTARLSASVEF